MKMKNVLFTFVLFLASFPVFVTGEEVSVTVYNNDLALVRETRLIDLKKGVQKYQFQDVAAKIDPTSVHFKSLTYPDKVALLEQNFEFDLVGTERLLEKLGLKSRIIHLNEGHVGFVLVIPK